MTIPELLAAQAERHGDKTFIICDGEEYSYRTINDRAATVAANLQRRGAGPGDMVMVLTGNCLEFLYVFLGAGRIGAVCVPVNPMLKPEEIAYIAQDAGAKILITVPEFAPMLDQAKQMIPSLAHAFVLGEAAGGGESFEALLEPAGDIPEIAAEEEDLAALIYTSGTTGTPKGVMLTHNNYIWNARMLQRRIEMNEADRFLCVLPLFHVNAQVTSTLSPLMAGGDVLLMKKFNPFAILPMIEQYRTTILSAVPTIYNVICRMPGAEKHDVSSMRLFASGAAPLSEETYALTQRVLKQPLVMGYGLSEATCASAVADPRDPIKWDSVGSALRYTGIRILGEDGADVPVGEIGEILVSGPAVMKGYYNDAEATEAVLRDGWLRTGDLGRLDNEGYLFVVGRVKELIIRGGLNVYPQQIEAVLSKLPGVEECAVVGVDEPRWGQEVLAVIKTAEGHSLDERTVLEYCREHLAQYKCPRLVRFVEDFPKTATGKIKKNEVLQQLPDIGG